MGQNLIYDPDSPRKYMWVSNETLKLLEELRREKGLPPVTVVETREGCHDQE